ncbi:MAG TPA: arsenate reductase (glutaredoxin) [Burkholderiales bacterium]|nr:arsenate reductase (glutaredoxin) [Burkholderiales bacterium]
MAGNEQAITIYHNPRCGKSRAALDILEKSGVAPRIVEYLKTPPTRDELRAILKKLCMKPEQLVRKGEDVYKQKYAGKPMTDGQWLDALAQDPILIERPIILKGNRAVIGRPPENVNALL